MMVELTNTPTIFFSHKFIFRTSLPHNVPFILLGAGLLWFGWFGFNAGSALASGLLATVAFVATNTGAASGALTWLILEKVLRGKPTAIGAATGAVAGLVGITPAAGFVTPLAAILIGSITAVVCFYAVTLKAKLQFDGLQAAHSCLLVTRQRRSIFLSCIW